MRAGVSADPTAHSIATPRPPGRAVRDALRRAGRQACCRAPHGNKTLSHRLADTSRRKPARSGSSSDARFNVAERRAAARKCACRRARARTGRESFKHGAGDEPPTKACPLGSLQHRLEVRRQRPRRRPRVGARPLRNSRNAARRARPTRSRPWVRGPGARVQAVRLTDVLIQPLPGPGKRRRGASPSRSASPSRPS